MPFEIFMRFNSITFGEKEFFQFCILRMKLLLGKNISLGMANIFSIVHILEENFLIGNRVNPLFAIIITMETQAEIPSD